MKLRDFRVLTFDCYGTLIDWETGLFTALQPLLARAKVALDRDAVLAAFAEREAAQQAATPAMRYDEVLRHVHAQLAESWGVAADPAEDAAFGASVADWPAFPDTPDALRALGQHFKLVILSNVDRASFRHSAARLGVNFDAVLTAEEIGSYKPDPRNFTALIDHVGQMGFARSQILHTAQSLFHDHVPANAAGLASAWIDRRHDAPGHGATKPPAAGVRWDFRFTSLGEMAEAYRRGL